MLTDLKKIISLLETAINYIQNKFI